MEYREHIVRGVDRAQKETLQEVDSKLIVELRERIKSLENQLLVKDSQIDSLLRQSENSQVLLKQQHDRILLLNEPKDEVEKRWFRKWFL